MALRDVVGYQRRYDGIIDESVVGAPLCYKRVRGAHYAIIA